MAMKKKPIESKEFKSPRVGGGHPESLLQQARKRAKVSQTKACDNLLCSMRSLQRYEAGEREPKYSLIQKMALLYGCSCDALMFKEKAESPSTVQSIEE